MDAQADLSSLGAQVILLFCHTLVHIRQKMRQYLLRNIARPPVGPVTLSSVGHSLTPPWKSSRTKLSQATDTLTKWHVSPEKTQMSLLSAHPCSLISLLSTYETFFVEANAMNISASRAKILKFPDFLGI